MMPKNLRYLVAKGMRSIGSRRNFGSWPGTKGKSDSDLVGASEKKVYPFLRNLKLAAWFFCGMMICSGQEILESNSRQARAIVARNYLESSNEGMNEARGKACVK